MLKFVFYVEDSVTKEIIVEKSQIDLDILDEVRLQQLDAADAAKLGRANSLIGENYANQVLYGRSKFLRDKFEMIGVTVSAFLDRKLSTRFGCKHIEMLDKWRKENANL